MLTEAEQKELDKINKLKDRAAELARPAIEEMRKIMASKSLDLMRNNMAQSQPPAKKRPWYSFLFD